MSGIQDFSALAAYAKDQMSQVEQAAKPNWEETQVNFLIEFAKIQTARQFDSTWDKAWRLAAPANAAFGDGQFLEQLIRLIELLLPILLRILFPEGQVTKALSDAA